MQRSSTLRPWNESDTLYNLTDPVVLANPYPFFTQIQEIGPLYFDKSLQVSVCTSFQQGKYILQQAKQFGANSLHAPDATITSLLTQQLLVQEGGSPRHKHLRSLMQPTFRASSYHRLREDIRDTCTQLLEPLKLQSTPSFDLISTYAGLLPTRISAELLGLPSEHLPKYIRWNEAYEHFLGLPLPEYELLPTVIPTMHEELGFLTEFVATRRRVLATRGITTAENITDQFLLSPFHGRLAEDADVVAQLIVLLAGGYKTAAHLIAMTLYWLQRVEQLPLVKQDHTLLPQAVRECMSFDGSSQFLARKAKQGVAIAETTIKQGETVFVILPAANRQWRGEQGFHEFDCLRPAHQHLGFGAGSHFCPGGPLAEYYATIALDVLLEAFPSLCVDETTLRWGSLTGVRCPDSLHVKIAPASSSTQE